MTTGMKAAFRAEAGGWEEPAPAPGHVVRTPVLEGLAALGGAENFLCAVTNVAHLIIFAARVWELSK